MWTRDRYIGHCVKCEGLVPVGWTEPPHHLLTVTTLAVMAAGWATPITALLLLAAWGVRVITSAEWGCRQCGNAITLTRIIRMGS